MITAKLTAGQSCTLAPDAYIGYKEHGGKIVLGNNVTIMHGCVIRTCTGVITLGNWVSVGYNCIMHGMGGIDIGDLTLISPGAHIYAQSHGMLRGKPMIAQENTPNPVSIGEDCWIGAGAIILGGTVIRKGCIIGAGVVMSQTTGEYEIWAGNPAVKIGVRE